MAGCDNSCCGNQASPAKSTVNAHKDSEHSHSINHNDNYSTGEHMIYEYECQTCGKEYEACNTIAEHWKGPDCCGQMTKQVIRTAPRGYVDNMEEYMCPVTNTYVSTRRQRNEIMKREGLIDANDILKSREFREKQTAAVEAERKRIQDEIPEAIRSYGDQLGKRAVENPKADLREL